MDIEELFYKRRSIRCFEETPVSKDYIEKMLEAARLAPSATNRQPWKFLIVNNKDTINYLGEAVIQPFVTGAPLIFICCIDKKSFTKELTQKRVEELVDAEVINREVANLLYKRKMPEKAEEAGIPVSAYIDMGIAIEHMVLAATGLGLGSCWVRMFDAEKVIDILKMDPDIYPVVLLPVGFPAENPPFRPRLSLKDIVLKSDLSF